MKKLIALLSLTTIILPIYAMESMEEILCIQELCPTQTKSTTMNQAHEIFTTYFIDLYKNIPASTLGIHNLEEYLDTIFKKTKIALSHKEAYAFLAYTQDNLAGFTVCKLSD